MIPWILSNIVCHEFDVRVGKGHLMKSGNKTETFPTMHIGWSMSVHSEEEQKYQYKTVHMLICGPMNYVHVVTQVETIDMDGVQRFEPMESLSYHDSCWRDAIQRFIFKNRDQLSQARSSENLMGWWDQYELTRDEVDYLGKVRDWRTGMGWTPESEMPQELVEENIIQKRWVR